MANEMTLEQKRAIALANARLRVQKTDAMPKGRGSWLADIAAEVVNPNIAPLATAAGAGFLAGGPMGAAVATGGLLASDLAVGGVVNPLLQAFGQETMQTPSEVINALYGPQVVAPEATTPGRRAARTIGAFVAPTRGTIGAVDRLTGDVVGNVARREEMLGDIRTLVDQRDPTSQIQAARQLTNLPARPRNALIEPGVTRNVLTTLAEKPGAQTAAAIGAGTAVGAGEEAGVTDPFQQLALAAVGGVAPSAAAIPLKAGVRSLYNVVEPFTPGGAERVKARAYLEAFDNDPNKVQQAINLLELGTPPEKVATAMNASGFAALLGTARNANTIVKDLYLARDAALQQGRANELAIASRSINALRGNIDTAETARANALLAQDEQAAAATRVAQRELAGRLPRTSQRDIGRTVTERRAQEVERIQNQVVRPAYQEAFAAAPDPFSFEGVEATARQLAGETGTALNPQQAPYTSDVISLYKAKLVEQPQAADGMSGLGGERAMVEPEIRPAMVTLEEADTFIKALNQDLAALSGNTDPSANATRRNLMKLKTAAERAIEEGTKDTNAAELYKAARTAHREQIVERFRTGWVANLEREGATGVQILAPERVVKTILEGEDNAVRFLSAFGEDQLAKDAVRNGVVDRFRREVVRNDIVDPRRAADFMRKYDDALRTLDDAGLNISQELDSFSQAAARLETTGEAATARAAAEFAPQRDQLRALERQARVAANKVGVDPQKSAQNLDQLLATSEDIANVVNQVRRDLADKRRFTSLVREGVRAGGGVKGLATEQAGSKLQVFDQLFTFANFLLTRAQGRVDAKLAVDIAKEMLSSDPAAKALVEAMVKGQRSQVGEMLQRPAVRPGAGAAVNVLAPVITNQNSLRE
jgi:hypothetical protein